MNHICFLGTPDFSIPVLQAIHNTFSEAQISVITMPDKPQGRSSYAKPSAIKLCAIEKGLTVHTPHSRHLLTNTLFDIRPDLIIVVAYGMILEKKITDSFFCINIHTSLLPKYRGASPIHTCLLNGDSETGVTIIKMNENMDEGDILHQKKMFIYPQDTLGTLSQRLSVMAAEECVFLIKNYFANQHIKAVPQDHSLATYTKKISKNDLFIESFSNQWAVHCKIRAFSPKPGAYIRHNNKRIKLILSEFTNNQLILHQVQPEGKAIMSYSDYLLGNPLGFFYDH